MIKRTENMNFSSPRTITAENEFFKELYSNTGLKQFTVVAFFIGTFSGLVLELGIIWYERHGSHTYRTVINQLFSTTSWFVVAYILFVYIPEGTRYLIGPLSEEYCDFHFFTKNFISNCIVLALDFITLLRYIFIFKLSNFAVVNDALLARTLQVTTVVLGLWLATVKKMSFGKMPLFYYMCTGKDPSLEYGRDRSVNNVPKYDTFAILVVVSVILNIFALAKIFLYQRQMEKRTQKIELGHFENSFNTDERPQTIWQNNNQKKIRNMPKSMADLSTQALCFLINAINVVINITISKMEPAELNDYGNRWLIYYVQIIGIAVAISGISLQYYIKNFSSLKIIYNNFRGH